MLIDIKKFAFALLACFFAHVYASLASDKRDYEDPPLTTSVTLGSLVRRDNKIVSSRKASDDNSMQVIFQLIKKYTYKKNPTEIETRIFHGIPFVLHEVLDPYDEEAFFEKLMGLIEPNNNDRPGFRLMGLIGSWLENGRQNYDVLLQLKGFMRRQPDSKAKSRLLEQIDLVLTSKSFGILRNSNVEISRFPRMHFTLFQIRFERDLLPCWAVNGKIKQSLYQAWRSFSLRRYENPLRCQHC